MRADRKVELCFAGLLGLGLLGGGCNDKADLAANVNLQCGVNPQSETAQVNQEMIAGQEVNIGGWGFTVTKRGRLRYSDPDPYPDAISIGSDDFVVVEKGGGFRRFSDKRYLVTINRIGRG